MKHVNRRGDTYYAFEGVTKTGKPKYFASKKSSSDAARRMTAMPQEFEFYENPTNGTVVIRRIKESDILPSELELLSDLVVRHCDCQCRVVIEDNSLVVYSAASPSPGIQSLMGMFGTSVAELSQYSNYSADLKFELVDHERRTFSSSRYCHRSFMEGWMHLGRKTGSLSELATKLLPHLGKESFFELY